MKKPIIFALAILFAGSLPAFAKKDVKKPDFPKQFFEEIKKHCGNAYEGTAIAGGDAEPFAGQKLVMHVISCKKNEIKIPFYVGEDRSRTWVLTLKGGRILLKHDHRHEDGAPDKITMYGGMTTNTGNAGLQVFPADQETAELIDYAVPNVWWMTIDEKSFTYNLRRVGTERLFTVQFDFDKKLEETPAPPWGWQEK